MPFFKRKSEKQKSVPPQFNLPGDIAGGTHKRTLSNRSNKSDSGSHLINGDVVAHGQGAGGGKPKSLQVLVHENSIDGSNELCAAENHPPMNTTSKLTKSFREILCDKDALSCFVQFMESRKSGKYMQFWLDAESFQATTWSRKRTQSTNSEGKHSKRHTSGQSETMSSSGEEDSNSLNRSPKSGDFASQTHFEVGAITDNLDVNIPFQRKNIESKNDLSICFDKDDKRLILIERDKNPMIDSVGDECSSYCDKDRLEDENASPTSVGSFTDFHSADSISSDCDPVISTASKCPDSNRGDICDRLKKSIGRDAVNIFTKYLAHDALFPIGLTDQLRNCTIRQICNEKGEVDPKCFESCQEFVVKYMEENYYRPFLQSELYCKHQVHVLTSCEIFLNDVLYNDNGLFYFMEFMEIEGHMDLLQFWMALDNFQQHLQSNEGNYDGMQAQTDAMVLYDKYFSLQASYPSGFGDKMRFEIESNICREEGPLPDCFKKPRDAVYRILERIYFPVFMKSEIYYKFLSDLVNTVQMAQDLPNRTHKRTDSDVSSEHSMGSCGTTESISSKNTLLATSSKHYKALNKLTDDMSIDAGLFNPDALWKRTKSGQLSFGKIDSLGQFVSEVDPQPEKGKHKGTGLFKKYRYKEKEQEEMAVKVAQMIISDVTNVTLSTGEGQTPNQ